MRSGIFKSVALVACIAFPASVILAWGDNAITRIIETQTTFIRHTATEYQRRVAEQNQLDDFLAKRNYKIAQVTIDWEDYLWNTAYARCLDKHDTQAIASLRAFLARLAPALFVLGKDVGK